MDLLASYGEDIGDDSATNSPKDVKGKPGNAAGALLENEWLSFEKMIAPGGIQGDVSVDRSTYLVDGFVAYPGMSMMRKPSLTEVLPEVQSSESDSDEENGVQDKNNSEKNSKEAEEDDAFFKMRKQVKARDGSSSSGDSSDSSSDSSRSPSPKKERNSLSPPHLSPVNSVKSHGSEPPELVHTDNAVKGEEQTDETQVGGKVVEGEVTSESKTTDKERKRSHRDRSRSKSRSKKHRSRSRDRKHRHSSRDRRRHKDRKSSHKSRDPKRSRDRKSSDRKRSKSKERKRSKSREKHDSKNKSRSERRDSSRDRKKNRRSKSRSHSRDRKRSKSKERKERRDRSRDRKKSHGGRSRHRSKDRKSRSRSKHRSRSRERQRSRERLRSRSPVMGKKLTFKEQMRQNLLTAGKQMTQEKAIIEPEIPSKRSGEPLKPSDLLKGIRITSGESVTPQQALMQTMAAMHQKAQEITGIEVPKYYNPAAVNPLKYAEQVQKRKLLWSKKGDDKQKEKEEQIETQWKSAFIADDNATTTKFRKLMGMKDSEDAVQGEDTLGKMSEEQRKKQQELFQRLDQEYQFARMTTHTQRGVGLGFSSTVYDPNHPANPP